MSLKRTIKWFYAVLCFVICSGCGDRIPEDEIPIIDFLNNSTHTVLISLSVNYPDTSLIETSDVSCSEVPPYSKCEAKSLHGWKDKIASNEQGVLLFFIFDLDTLKKYGADFCREEYLILKRYELTEANLESIHWTITYP